MIVYKKNAEQYSASKTIVFSYPTDSTLSITKAAVEAIKTIFKQGISYKKAGVIVTGTGAYKQPSIEFISS